jgi:hypothetical protein
MITVKTIIREAVEKFPVIMQEEETVVHEVMRKGLDDPDIPEEKKAIWREFLSKKIGLDAVDINHQLRVNYINRKADLALQRGLLSNKESKQIKHVIHQSRGLRGSNKEVVRKLT